MQPTNNKADAKFMILHENSFYDFSMPIFEIENYILNLSLSVN
jgi:hypothetical protein